MNPSVIIRIQTKAREHSGFLVILTIFTVLALSYNLTTPIGESDNEQSHFRYIQQIKTNWRLPQITTQIPEIALDDQCWSPSETLVDWAKWQFRQPPLYYTLSALVFWRVDTNDYWWPIPNQFAYHTGSIDGGLNAYLHTPDEAIVHRNVVLAVRLHRLFSTLSGIFGLIAVYLTGLLLLPSKRNWGGGLLVAAVAFVPTYIFASAVINNDILAGAFGLWAIYFYLRSVIDKPDLKAFAFGVFCTTLAFLTKYTAIVLIPVFVLALIILLVKSWRMKSFRSGRTFIYVFGIITLQALPLVWWFLRNEELYDNTFAGYNSSGVSFFDKVIYALSLADGIGDSSQAFSFTFNTYWGLLGADSLILPHWMLNLLWGVTLLAGLGLAIYMLQRSTSRRTKIIALAGFIIIVIDWYLIFSLTFYGTRGRYILSLYSIFAFLFILGASVFSTKRLPWLGSVVYVALLLGGSIFAPIIIIRPIFSSPPHQMDSTLFAGEASVYAKIDDLAELIGFGVVPQDIGPYMPVDVTLVWRVLNTSVNNYAVGVHLESADHVYLGGITHWPAKGSYATSLWHPGDVFRDTYRFYTESGAGAKLPTGAKVKVSMICKTGGRESYLPFYGSGGELLGDAVYSGPVRFAVPSTAELSAQPSSVLANFGGQVALIETSDVPASFDNFDIFTFDMRWQALVDLDKDYSVFIQLLDDQNNILAGADYPLTHNRYPSSLWLPGEQVEHRHDIDLSLVHLLPSGHYRLVTGIYDIESGERLPPVQDYDRGIPEGYLLGAWDWENYPIFMPIIMIPGETEGTE